MKAIITSASEVDQNGKQTVAFQVLKDDKILLEISLAGDVDTLQDQIKSFLADYEAKFNSENRLKEGDEIEV